MKRKILLLTIPFFISQLAFSQWAQVGTDIDGDASGSGDSGHSVSFNSDGTVIAIGAPLNGGNGIDSGHVRVYQWNGAAWYKLGQDIDGEVAGDQFGLSVSLSADGSRVAIGAILNDDGGNASGHVRIYQWDGSTWYKLGQSINGEAAGDISGRSVSLSADGNIVAIGAENNDDNGNNAGHVRIYQWGGVSWNQLGQDIDGEAAGDSSGGYSVSLSADGNIVAIGAIYNDGINGADSGHVRVYQWNGAAWNQFGQDIDGEAAGDQSGWSASLSADGSTVAIGAIYNDGINGANSGHVRVYQWDGAAWSQLGQDIDGEAAEDRSGRSVSLSADGSIVAIGAPYNDGNGLESGHARIYEFQGGNWVQLGIDIDGEAAEDQSGRSVSLSADGSIVAIGAPNNSGANNGAGHVRVFSNSDLDTSGLFVGVGTGDNNSTGTYNVFLGNYSGLNNTEGSSNTFVGHRSGFNNITGSQNTYLGRNSGFNNQTGSGNVFLGYQAGYNETASDRLYIENSDNPLPLIWGDFANDVLQFNGSVSISTIPNDDTLTQVLVTNNNGDINWRDAATLGGGGTPHDFPSYPESAGDGGGNTNSYFGHEAGLVNTGANNTFIGNQSGYSNTAGLANTAIGHVTLYSNDVGRSNTALGSAALTFNTSGSWNTATGNYALHSNNTGNGNTANGYQVLYNNNGNHNTAMGYQTLRDNQGGSNNMAMGYQALFRNISGNNNVALGRDALFYNETGSQNVAIGFNAGPTAGNTGLTNTIAIGSNAAITASNQVILGNFEVEDIGGAATWTVVSDGRFKINVAEDVAGLDFIKSLRPVSYNLDRRKIREFIGNTTATNSDVSKKTVGFIAQEVEQLVNENGYIFSGVKTPHNEKDHYGLKYSEFVVPLVKAIQEQQQIIETLKQEIETLKTMVYGTGSTTTSSTSLKEENTLLKGFALEQNVPNPFDKTTTIKAMVPESVQKAKIIVYNLQGLELESYPIINNRGNVSVEISAGRFPSGMYLYTLIAGGQVIDTKKMILTR